MTVSRKWTPNCVTTFESYCREYEWKISRFECHLSRSEPLQCPEVIRSPPGKFPHAEWRLETLGVGSVRSSSSYCYSNSAKKQPEPDSWTVKLGYWVVCGLELKWHVQSKAILALDIVICTRSMAAHSGL